MSRCFGDFLEVHKPNFPTLKKTLIQQNLKSYASMDAKLHGQDVARLVHAYLLATLLFMPSRSTSIKWSVISHLEEFDQICTFDWSSYIVSYLTKQLETRTDMKIGGCAMLLPVRFPLLI